MRSQANTAKILEASPTLMRLRELEVLEKVSEKANLTVALGGRQDSSPIGRTNHSMTQPDRDREGPPSGWFQAASPPLR
jgi:hypothetical protein